MNNNLVNYDGFTKIFLQEIGSREWFHETHGKNEFNLFGRMAGIESRRTKRVVGAGAETRGPMSPENSYFFDEFHEYHVWM